MFKIKSVKKYVKDSDCKVKIPREKFAKTKLENRMEIQVSNNKLSEKNNDHEYEVILDIMVKLFALFPDKKMEVATIKVIQAGIFLIELQNLKPHQIEQGLEVNCAASLYWDTGKKVFELTKKNHLPPVQLPRFNFLDLYKHNIKMRQQRTSSNQVVTKKESKKTQKPVEKIIKPKLTVEKQDILLDDSSCELNVTLKRFNELQMQSQLKRKIKTRLYCEQLNKTSNKLDNCKFELYIIIEFLAENIEQAEKVAEITLDQIGEFTFKNGANATQEEIEKMIKINCAQQVYDYAKNEFLQLGKKEQLNFKALPDRSYLNIYRCNIVKQLIIQSDKLNKNAKFEEAMKVSQKAFCLAYQLKDNDLQTKLRSKISAIIYNIMLENPELALRYAAYWGDYVILQDIEENKTTVDINAPGNSGNTALHLAIKSKINDENKVKIVRWLMNNGADPNLKNQENKCPKNYLVSTHKDYRSLCEVLDQNMEVVSIPKI